MKGSTRRGEEAEFPLAVISTWLGKPSETFIHRQMTELLPGRTVVVVRSRTADIGPLEGQFPYTVLDRHRRGMPWALSAAAYALRVSPLSPIQQTVADLLQRSGARVVLSQYLNASIKWLKVSQTLAMPFYARAHGYDVSETLRDPKMRDAYLELNAATGVITMSEVSRARLIHLGLASEKIHVVPYGVDIAPSPALQTEYPAVRCLAVGRMVAKKAPLLTLRAFRQAKMNNPRLHLDFVGTGDLFDQVREFIHCHDLNEAVTLHGAKDHSAVLELMQQAHIFIQHSIVDPLTGDEEGLPVSILEAMANGLPVVSTRHAGIPEAVTEGQTGFLVDEGDVDAMSEYLISLSLDVDLRARLGNNGWLVAQESFSWARERAALLKLLALDAGGAESGAKAHSTHPHLGR